VPVTGDQIVEFLNTVDMRQFGHHRGTGVIDEIGSPPELKRWLRERGLVRASASVTSAEHRLALRLRTSMRALLEDRHDRQAAQELSELAKRLAVSVDFSGSQPELRRADSPTRAFLAELLAACATAAADGSWPLIKICAAEDCRWAFYDRSRNRQGRWCSTDVCGNRVKTRRYRERHR